MKYSKLYNLFQQAEIIAQNSKDLDTQVGCILITPDTYQVVATGYNGPIRGTDDAKIPNTRPLKYKYFQHAELNAVCQAARLNGGTSKCIAIVTLSPCSNCMRMLWNSGIKTIYFKDEYRDFQKQLEMKDLDIKVTKIGQYTKLELYVPNQRSVGRTIHQELKRFRRSCLGRLRGLLSLS